MTRDTASRSLAWEETSREHLLSCPVFTAYRSERRAGRGQEGEREQSGAFYILDARDWVTVVPVVKTEGGAEAFLMVRQYRHGIERVTLEFPAGIAEPDETPERAARRELAEETGHEATVLEPAGSMGAAPAFMTNWCHVFVATGLRKTGAQALDEQERLDVLTVPVAEVLSGIGAGELVNSITAMSLYCYLRYAAGTPLRSE